MQRRPRRLTAARVGRLLDDGKDYADVPGLDVRPANWPGCTRTWASARVRPDGVDEDYAPRLWELLAEPDPVPPPKHDPETIRRAADMVGPGRARLTPDGPLTFSAARWGGRTWPGRHPVAAAGERGAGPGRRHVPRDGEGCTRREVGPMRELRHALGQMRLNELAVGPDGRNRVLLSAFGSKTGRNQPSNSRFIFGPSCWLRSLIRPGPGRAVAYVDWSQQELGIAAALSGDPRMLEAYRSGDFYLTFAKMAGRGARRTRPSRPTARSATSSRRWRSACCTGCRRDGLARKLGVPPCRGRELLRLHRRDLPPVLGVVRRDRGARRC